MKESKDWDDIEVNKRSTDKVFFESTILQQISDSIDFIRDESKEILSELDYDGFEDLVVQEFGESTLDQLSDIADVINALF